MAQHAKNLKNNQSHKKHPSTFKSADAFVVAEEKIYDAERAGVEDLLQTGEDFNRAAIEGIDMCAENIEALARSGNRASRTLRDLSGAMMESCASNMSVCVDISREALCCRNISDVVELQSSALQQLSDSYFSTTKKLRDALFDSCAEAFALINRRTAVASNQMRRAMAA